MAGVDGRHSRLLFDSEDDDAIGAVRHGGDVRRQLALVGAVHLRLIVEVEVIPDPTGDEVEARAG
jgi:hypothetical protein